MSVEIVGAPTSDVVAAWHATQTVLRFTAAFDERDASTMKRHFTVDGAWERPGETIRGHDGIDCFVDAIDPSTRMRHVITNQRVSVLADGAELQVDSYFTVYVCASPDADVDALTPKAIGQYRDQVCTDGEVWRISRRVVEFAIAR